MLAQWSWSCLSFCNSINNSSGQPAGGPRWLNPVVKCKVQTKMQIFYCYMRSQKYIWNHWCLMFPSFHHSNNRDTFFLTLWSLAQQSLQHTWVCSGARTAQPGTEAWSGSLFMDFHIIHASECQESRKNVDRADWNLGFCLTGSILTYTHLKFLKIDV